MAPITAHLEEIHHNDEYGIGATEVMTKDDAHNNTLGLYLRFYYPTEKFEADAKSDDSSMAMFRTNEEDYAHGCGKTYEHLPVVGRMFRGYVASKLKKANRQGRWPVKWNAALRRSDKPQPVVVFSPGFTGGHWGNNGICAALVSTGFIVCCIEPANGTCAWTHRQTHPGGINLKYHIPLTPAGQKTPEFRETWFEMISPRAEELLRTVAFVRQLNEGGVDTRSIYIGQQFDWSTFGGQLDADRTIVIGHSLGGPTIIEALLDDKEKWVKAAMLLDAPLAVHTRTLMEPIWQLDVPMFHLMAHGQLTEHELERHEICVKKNPSRVQMATLKGSGHMSFGDTRWMPTWLTGTKMAYVRLEQLLATLALELVRVDNGAPNMEHFPSDGTKELYSDCLFVPVADELRRKMDANFVWE